MSKVIQDKELVKQAKELGIEVHHRWNNETITNKINSELAELYKANLEAAQAQVDSLEEETQAEVPQEAPTLPKRPVRALTKAEFREADFQRRKRDAQRLIRVRVACMDPDRRKHPGAVYSTGSSKMGKIAKYVPFNVPWYVPKAIVEILKEAKFSTYYEVPDGNGGMRAESRLIPTYSVEILPDLTENELKELAQQQAMREGSAEALRR